MGSGKAHVYAVWVCLFCCAGAALAGAATPVDVRVREHRRVAAYGSQTFYAVCFCPTTGDVVAAQADRRLVRYRRDSYQAEPLPTWPRGQSFAWMQLAADERHLLIFSDSLEEQTLHVLDLRAGYWASHHSLGSDRGTLLVTRPDGRESLFSCEAWLSLTPPAPAPRKVTLWPDVLKATSQPCLVSPQVERSYFGVSAASRDLTRIVARSFDQSWLYEWDAGAARLIRALPQEIGTPWKMDPTGSFLVSTHGQDFVVTSLTDPNLPRIARCTTDVPLADIRNLALDRRGAVVAVAGSSSIVELWDPRAGVRLTTLDTGMPAPRSVTFCPAGDYLVVVASQGALVYELAFAGGGATSRPAVAVAGPQPSLGWKDVLASIVMLATLIAASTWTRFIEGRLKRATAGLPDRLRMRTWRWWNVCVLSGIVLTYVVSSRIAPRAPLLPTRPIEAVIALVVLPTVTFACLALVTRKQVPIVQPGQEP